MDILRLYRSQSHSPQLTEDCQRAYAQLREERTRAAKFVIPFAFLVAVTSIRRRSPWQICRNFILMSAGGMGVQEVMAWNSLSGKLYLMLRANSNE